MNELQQAIIDKDLVEVADALCDIQYVLSGAVLEFGFGEKFADLFTEVYRKSDDKTLKSVNYSPAALDKIIS